MDGLDGEGSGLVSNTIPRAQGSFRRGAIRIATTLLSIVVILGIWQLAISVSDVSSYITKSPMEVLDYLLSGNEGRPPTPAGGRDDIPGMMLVTLYHAGVGFVCGVSFGIIGSLLMVSSKTINSMFLPLAIFLQTVPLVALAPIIYAVFGSGVVTAAVIASVVMFFTLLLNLMTGLRSPTPEMQDLVTVYGGSHRDLLRRVAIPAALPYLFAGLKIAAPATISAAMLYEYLFTFEGLGAAILTSRGYSDYNLMWTVVAISTTASVLLYVLVTWIERAVLGHRYPPRQLIG